MKKILILLFLSPLAVSILYSQPVISDPGNMSAYRGNNWVTYDVYLEGTTNGGIWGCNTYTDDSDCSTAAVHTGYVNDGVSKVIRFRIKPDNGSYSSCTQNGITSNSYGPWIGSFDITYSYNMVAATITTNSVSSITTTSAVCGGNVSSYGSTWVTERGLCYSTSTNPDYLDSRVDDPSVPGSGGTGSFSLSITGLTESVTYYVRAYAKNNVGVISYGSQQSFTTTNPTPTSPTITTQAVSSISANTATGNGNITDLGFPNPTQHGVCWSTSENPTISNSKTEEGIASNTGAFTSNITGLSENTTYYVRAYATNSVNTAYGSQVSFTTNDLPYSGGSGTSGSPYQISNLNDLIELTTTQADWGKYFIQTTDIDASVTQYWDDSDDDNDGNPYNDTNDGTSSGSNEGWKSIGVSYSTAFSGNYDGNGYTISNLKSNRASSNYIGFFGWITGGSVSHLNMDNIDLTGENYVAFITYNDGGDINNCHIEGSISGSYNGGGITGENGSSGLISYCSFNGTISISGDIAGGIAGTNSDHTGTLSHCWSSGSITSNTYCGGIVGYLKGTVEYCYSTSSITSPYSDYKGGIAGYANGYTSPGPVITNCYSACNGANLLGSTMGSNSPTITNCFYDVDAAGLGGSSGEYNYGAYGKTVYEMKTQSTFTNWDFNTRWSISQGAEISYPYLQNNLENPVPGYSITKTWDGSESSAWNNASNWAENFTPAATNNAIITTDGNAPVIESGVSADCKDLTVNSGASLTIASGGSLITTGTISNNGTINIEKSITNDTWHLFGSPITSATSTYFTGNYLQNWNEPTATWSEITNPDINLTPGKGYGVYTTSKASLTFTGTPNTGSVPINISYTAVQDSARDGANLLGNPYPSSIDWDQVSGFGSVYYWDGSQYLSYPQTGSYGTGSQYIPPMQGFFIVVPDADPSTFTFTNAMRTHNGATNYYKSDKTLKNGVMLSAKSGEKDDLLLIRYHPEASQNFDFERDALKLKAHIAGKSEIWSIAGDDELSIDVRNDIETIPLGYYNDLPGNYAIEMKEVGNIGSVEIEDTKLNKFHDLSQGAYEFDWQTTDSEERFILHLKATGTTNLEAQDAQVYSANGQVYVRMDEADSFNEIMIYDLAGRLIYQSQLSQQNLQSFNLNQLQGAYLVQLVSDKGTQVEKVILE